MIVLLHAMHESLIPGKFDLLFSSNLHYVFSFRLYWAVLLQLSMLFTTLSKQQMTKAVLLCALQLYRCQLLEVVSSQDAQ